ncbi:MAG: SDR family oxidoreductase [Rhodospirillales bacterium]|nr:SDR family oxidoreductase [Rhodospirillales bacterium]
MAQGRVALVTHVNHFAGRPAAEALAGRGMTVLCHDAEFTCDATRNAFAADHPGLHPLAEQRPEDIVERATAAFGHIDVLVNNDAFPAIRAAVEDAHLDDLRAGLEAMVVAPFALARAVVPQMKARRDGKILFVTSAAPLRGLPNYSTYVAARGAANALAVSLARELARFSIQVNAVAPNFVESPTYFPPELLADAATLKKITDNVPLGRLARPEELGALIAFLASPDADFITGHVMPFAGGWA